MGKSFGVAPPDATLETSVPRCQMVVVTVVTPIEFWPKLAISVENVTEKMMNF
jgi:hypothetical protein